MADRTLLVFQPGGGLPSVLALLDQSDDDPSGGWPGSTTRPRSAIRPRRRREEEAARPHRWRRHHRRQRLHSAGISRRATAPDLDEGPLGPGARPGRGLHGNWPEDRLYFRGAGRAMALPREPRRASRHDARCPCPALSSGRSPPSSSARSARRSTARATDGTPVRKASPSAKTAIDAFAGQLGDRPYLMGGATHQRRCERLSDAARQTARPASRRSSSAMSRRSPISSPIATGWGERFSGEGGGGRSEGLGVC